MPINWSLLGDLSGQSTAKPRASGIDWTRLGFGLDDEDELAKAKRRKLAELAGLANASDLVGQDPTEELIKKRQLAQPGLQVNPIAARIGQRQAGEMGIDESPRNTADTLLGGAELFGREVMAGLAAPGQAVTAADDWLKKKAIGEDYGAGNINLRSRPEVKNADGTTSTVRSVSFNVDGKEVLVPTVSEDGRILSDKEALAEYLRTGKHLGMFDSPESATEYAERLHNRYESGEFKRPSGSLTSALAEGVRNTVPGYAMRLQANLARSTGLPAAAERNQEAITRVTEDTIANAEHPVLGWAAASVGRGLGMAVDPLAAAIGAPRVAAKLAAKAADKVELPAKLTSRLFSKEGGMPEEPYDILQGVKRAGEGADFESARTIEKVDREIQSEMDKALALYPRPERIKLEASIMNALTSGNPADMASLPASLQKPVSAMRAQVDEASHQITREALRSDEAAKALRLAVKSSGDPDGMSQFFSDRNEVRAAADVVARLVDEFNLPRPTTTEELFTRPDILEAAAKRKKLSQVAGAAEVASRVKAFSETSTPEVLTGLAAVGRHLDSLNPRRRAVAEHYLPVLTKIESQVGKYLRTNYEAYDDPRWAKELLSAGEKSYRWKDLTDWAQKVDGQTPEQADKWARRVLTEIEQNWESNARRGELFPEFPEAAKGALKKKKHVPVALQEFLGVNKDWRQGFQRSMIAASEIASEIKMWDELAESGGGNLFALAPEGTSAVNALGHTLPHKVTKGTRMIAPDGQAVYTYPEIGKILDASNQMVKEGTGRWWLDTANSLARFGWTVANPAVHAVNVTSNLWQSLKTGHLGALPAFVREYKNAVGSEWSRLMGGIPNPQSREYEEFLGEVAKRGGMTTGGAIADERKHLGALYGKPSRGVRGKLSEGPEEALGVGTGWTRTRDALKAAAGTTMDLASSAFTAADQAVRVSHIKMRAADLAKAFPGWSKDKILDEAVRRGLNELPSPENSPKIIQGLRQNPVAGSLLTYPAEITRTMGNTLRYTFDDLRTALTASDEELAAMGADRAQLLALGSREAAGVLASLSIVPTLAWAAKTAVNKAHPGANDPQRIEDIKRFEPEYYQNNSLMVVGQDKGNALIMDWTPVDAYGNLTKPVMAIMAALREDDSAYEAAVAGAEEFFRPYTSLQPLSIAGMEALTGKTRGGTGGNVTNPEKDFGGQAADWGAHLSKTLAPYPVRFLSRAKEAVQTGDRFIAEKEMASWFGARLHRFNLAEKMTQTARDRAASYRDLLALRNEAVRKDFLVAGAPAVVEAESEAQTKWATELSKELTADIEAARRLGKSDPEILNLFTDSTGLPKYQIQALMQGKTLPLRWSDR